MIRYVRFDTPLGRAFATASAGALTGVHFEGARHAPVPRADWIDAPEDPVLRECVRQLGEYFRGERRRFELATDARGTAFQRRIWREIAAIAYGETLTYSVLAARAGAPGAARAAGAATGRNPLAIVVPCHRVLGAAGGLTGYAGGLERKARLLALEGALLEAAA